MSRTIAEAIFRCTKAGQVGKAAFWCVGQPPRDEQHRERDGLHFRVRDSPLDNISCFIRRTFFAASVRARIRLKAIEAVAAALSFPAFPIPFAAPFRSESETTLRSVAPVSPALAVRLRAFSAAPFGTVVVHSLSCSTTTLPALAAVRGSFSYVPMRIDKRFERFGMSISIHYK